ncbi:hypothetical protein NFI96_013734 [Prochilodus magdalenae]|nr:hypothetical protein NFI96_013734 [Prochilodus magdalenae]
MVSIIRATTTDFMYSSKNDVQAMAKRLVEYYLMLRDNTVNCKHTWVVEALHRILDISNRDFFILTCRPAGRAFMVKLSSMGFLKRF